ncbi:MAG: oxidoreductase [Firmicutes bacterium]|nr:oxidoreductase [Bacillota bacterium]MBR0482143.1 oxidoreductase [Bacillota bacterium]
MTESSLKSISPDSITGMIFAMEGMKNTVVLLNGPMGCRFYHSTTSQYLCIRPVLYLPEGENGEKYPVDYNTLNDWFFRQERVPCTYLDGYDYVYSTRDKVGSAMEYISANIDFDIIAIVNSPGAALIGDNLLELAREKLGRKRVVMLESSGYSLGFDRGYSDASLAMLRQVGMPLWKGSGTEKPGKGNKKVNLLGMSIWQRNIQGDLEELRRLFSLCGIDVNAALCADCSFEELKKLPEADLNVVVYPEGGLACAEYLKEELGMPMYVCETLPIGFSAVEKTFSDICRILGCSFDALREESEKARALAWYKIREIDQAYGKPKGVLFYVDGGETLERSYEAFLQNYLAMKKSSAEDAELVFSNANVISELMIRNKHFCGIEIGLPGMGYTDLLPKTHMGIKGSLFLIEQVLNGLMSRI